MARHSPLSPIHTVLNPPIRNLKHQKFAELVAIGENPGKAYVAAGFKVDSHKVALTNAKRLLKNADILLKVQQLAGSIQHHVVVKTALSREWVVDELMDNVRIAKTPDEKGRIDVSGANQALALLGKELGMFSDQGSRIPWDGDLKKLTGEQLGRLRGSLEEIVEQYRSRQAQGIEGAGPVVEVQLENAANDAGAAGSDAGAGPASSGTGSEGFQPGSSVPPRL